MAKIYLDEWVQYRKLMFKLSEKAHDEFRDHFFKNSGPLQGTGLGNVDREYVIDLAYATVTKYAEGAAELACRLYDEIAEISNAPVPAAMPALTATRSEVGKVVNGVFKQSPTGEKLPGAIQRLVKQAAADTTLQNAARDGAQFAWVPAGDTCPFCIALASRGWQRISKKTLKKGVHAEHIHGNCDCQYAVRFDDKTEVEGYDPREYRYQYYSADGQTPKERINAMRRAYYQENKERINSQSRMNYWQKKQSGGKTYLPYDPDDPRAVKAAEVYKRISREYDADKIAKASEFEEKDIIEIKRHIFFEKHKLYEGYGILDPDYDIAVAWERLKAGVPEERDIILLRHELLEAKVEREYNLSLAEAHAIAKKEHDWEKALLESVGEEGEKFGIL